MLRGMRIDGYTSTQVRGAVVLPIALRVCDEESVLRREALDAPRTAVPLQRALERVVTGEKTSVVGDVLPQREASVHVERVHLDVAIVLLHDQRRLLGEVNRVCRDPPVAEIPRRIVMTAFVVEPVCELVACPAPTQRSVVRGVIGGRVEGLRDQAARGKYNPVRSEEH